VHRQFLPGRARIAHRPDTERHSACALARHGVPRPRRAHDRDRDAPLPASRRKRGAKRADAPGTRKILPRAPGLSCRMHARLASSLQAKRLLRKEFQCAMRVARALLDGRDTKARCAVTISGNAQDGCRCSSDEGSGAAEGARESCAGGG
jgi:hypothetical protein